MKEVLAVSDELVDELLAADHLAISTPVIQLQHSG